MLMSAPLTFPHLALRWTDGLDQTELLQGKLYQSFFLVLLLAFLLVLVIVNCYQRFNERRVLIGALILNLLSLLSFFDFNLMIQNE